MASPEAGKRDLFCSINLVVKYGIDLIGVDGAPRSDAYVDVGYTIYCETF